MNRAQHFFSESQALTHLALPIVLSQIAYVLLGMIDTIMAGQAGAEDQAAVALGVAFWMPVFVALMSVVQAVSPMVAHHFGAQDHAGIVHDTREGIWLALFSGAIPALLLPAVRPAMLAAQIDPELIAKTLLFLQGIVVGLPAALIFRALAFYSAGINQTKPMMVLAFLGIGVNSLFNWLLIWGHWGFPALGGAGCGWATAIGMWVGLLGMVGWTVWAPAYKHCYLWHGWSLPHWPTQGKLLKIGLPMGGAALAEVVAFTSVAVLVGRFGSAQIAAHQVAMNFSSLIFMLPMGLSAAATIRVGQALGAGEPQAASRTAWSAIGLGLIVAAAMIPLILLGRDALVSLYSPDPAVRQIASTLMLFALVWQFADAAQVVALGALRGYKITFAPMLVMFVAFWILGLPTGVWLGYTGIGSTGPLGVYGFWTALVLALILVALGLVFLLRKISRLTIRDTKTEFA